MSSVSPPDPDRVAEMKQTVRRLAAEADRIYKPGGEPEVELLQAQLRDANRTATQLAAEAGRERDLRAALSLHVAELERELREAKAELEQARARLSRLATHAIREAERDG